MQVQPYLAFEGRCEEALEFYRTALGAEIVMLMRFKDAPPSAGPGMVTPGTENKVMHARLKIGESVILASDGRCTGKTSFQGITLSLTPTNDSEAQRVFTALAKGGQVQMPLNKTFFASSFGMLADRFGVGWMIYVQA